MTYIDALNVAISSLSDAEAIEKLTALRGQYEKRASVIRKPTAKQNENSAYKSDIVAWMEPEQTYQVGDILKGVPTIAEAGLSVQRVSAMLTQLVNEGILVKSVDKRKSVYTLA